MWKARLLLPLVPLLFTGCKKEEVGPGACATGTSMLDGICRKTCVSDSDCLLNEFCDPVPDACVPEPITDQAKIKVFDVAPVPVSQGGTVLVDFGVVSADRVMIEVLWNDGTTLSVHDSTAEYFGTRRIENVTQGGTARITAVRKGMPQEQTRTIELDDGTPRLVKFEVDQARVTPGTVVTVSWEVENADAPINISIENVGDIVTDAPAKGSHAETVFDTTVFTITSGDLFASATVEVVVTPKEPQIINFEVRGENPSLYDYPVTIVWQTQDAIEAILEIDGVEGFTARSPNEVDRGVVLGTLTGGRHQVRLRARGLLGQEVTSAEIEVYFLENASPEIQRFEYPFFVEDNSGNAFTAAWSVGGPNIDVTQAYFAWSDLAIGAVALNDQSTHPFTGETISLGLRAESPAGAAIARGVVYAVRQEVEPNDEQASAQPFDGRAIDGFTAPLDPDTFGLGAFAADQTIVAQLFGPCSMGTSLAVTDDLGGGTAYISTFDGDCPALVVPAASNSPWYVTVSYTLADLQVPYRLAIDIQGPVCGDGTHSNTEACDDGGLLNGDGCDVNCLNEDLINYTIGGAVRPLEGRPFDARPIDFHPYPNGSGIPEDDGFGFAEIPSSFTFFERTYWAAIVHADGSINFVPDLDDFGFDPSHPLNGGAPEEVIAGFGHDLRRAGPASGVYTWSTETGGTAIEWENFVVVGNPGSRVDFRIILEPNGEIWLGYFEISGVDPAQQVHIGLQDRRGARTFGLPQCGETCTGGALGEIVGQFFQIVPVGSR